MSYEGTNELETPKDIGAGQQGRSVSGSDGEKLFRHTPPATPPTGKPDPTRPSPSRPPPPNRISAPLMTPQELAFAELSKNLEMLTSSGFQAATPVGSAPPPPPITPGGIKTTYAREEHLGFDALVKKLENKTATLPPPVAPTTSSTANLPPPLPHPSAPAAPPLYTGAPPAPPSAQTHNAPPAHLAPVPAPIDTNSHIPPPKLFRQSSAAPPSAPPAPRTGLPPPIAAPHQGSTPQLPNSVPAPLPLATHHVVVGAGAPTAPRMGLPPPISHVAPSTSHTAPPPPTAYASQSTSHGTTKSALPPRVGEEMNSSTSQQNSFSSGPPTPLSGPPAPPGPPGGPPAPPGGVPAPAAAKKSYRSAATAATQKIARIANEAYVRRVYARLQSMGYLQDIRFENAISIEWDTILADPAFMKKYPDPSKIFEEVKDTDTTQGFMTSMLCFERTMMDPCSGSDTPERLAMETVQKFVITLDMSLPESAEPSWTWDKETKILTATHNPLSFIDGVQRAQYVIGDKKYNGTSLNWWLGLWWVMNDGCLPDVPNSKGNKPIISSEGLIRSSQFNIKDNPQLAIQDDGSSYRSSRGSSSSGGGGRKEGKCSSCNGSGNWGKAHNFQTCNKCKGSGVSKF